MSSPLRILVVDDSLSMRIIATSLVTSLGHEVVGDVEDGKVALKKYHELKPDVVMLDFAMPRFDGKKTLKRIFEIDPSANVVICSFLDLEDEIEFCLREGAKFYLKKPYGEERIKNALNSIATQTAQQS